MTNENKRNDDAAGSDEDYAYDPTIHQDAGSSEEIAQAAESTRHLASVKASAITEKEDLAAEIRREPNLVRRAKALVKQDLVSFPEVTFTNMGASAVDCDRNRLYAMDVLFGRGGSSPHVDLFRGVAIDWNGEEIDGRSSSGTDLLEPIAELGLRRQSVAAIERSFKDWVKRDKRNDMIESFTKRIPKWDGTPRMETKVIDLFKTHDTQLSREFGRYFWLSIYCRIMEPGCMAPMALAIFGAQNAGKSYFSKLICRTLMQNKDANSVHLDLGQDTKVFLRSITGRSLIANIGEMTGFRTTDMNNVKQFMTEVSDAMDQKYEKGWIQPRQWIVVMDGNKYVGLQRDDTGNRRFYPVFAGQLEDGDDGQPAWDNEFAADFTGFEGDVWQIMAECRAWLAENGGLRGYESLVRTVSDGVAAFSKSEMKRGRGTVKDDFLDDYLMAALKEPGLMGASILMGYKNNGISFPLLGLKKRLGDLSGGHVPTNRINSRMEALGFERPKVNNEYLYLMSDVFDCKTYFEKLGFERWERFAINMDRLTDAQRKKVADAAYANFDPSSREILGDKLGKKMPRSDDNGGF